MAIVETGPPLAAAVGALSLGAVLASAVARLGVGAAVATALARAGVQLAVVSLAVAAVLGSVPLAFAFVALMAAVACATAARRITPHRSGLWAAVAVAAGVVPVLALALGMGAVPLDGPGLVALAGIVVGGTMSATGVAGRRALDELLGRHGEYEAALALGLPPREAGLEICRSRTTQALWPGLDQTRTVGLVALPGTFVGVLLGGGTAAEAGAAQLLILAALLAAQTVAVAVVLELVVRGRVIRGQGG